MQKRIHSWLYRITFPNLFFYWILIIIGFGVVYYYVHQRIPILVGQRTIETWDAIYFSFVTATTIGYGDILPVGIGRLLAVVEGIFGLLLYGIVISKLVSYKQEQMLEQIYKVSSDQKLSEIRNALYLFRTDLARATERINSRQSKSVDFRVTFTALDAILIDANRVLFKKNDGIISSDAKDKLHLELVLHSVALSLFRLLDFLSLTKKKHILWRSKKTLENIHSIRESLGKIIDHCKRIKSLQGLEKVQMIGEAYMRLRPYVQERKPRRKL